MLKKVLMAGTALLALGSVAAAADLPVKSAPYGGPPMVQGYSWSGFWIGLRGGYGVNSESVSTISNGTTTIDIGSPPKGFVGGIDAGINFQLGPQFVTGIYVEQDFADLRSSTSLGTVTLGNVTNYLGAAGARFGYLVSPANLLYVKGGFAWVGAHPDFSAIGTSKAITDTSVGYELGAGLEHRFGTNWSVKIEYDHTHAGDKVIDIGGGLSSTAKYNIDKGMIGFNYLF